MVGQFIEVARLLAFTWPTGLAVACGLACLGLATSRTWARLACPATAAALAGFTLRAALHMSGVS